MIFLNKKIKILIKSETNKLGKIATNWQTTFSVYPISDLERNYYMTDNDFVNFIKYFEICIVASKITRTPVNISDCNFYAIKK